MGVAFYFRLWRLGRPARRFSATRSDLSPLETLLAEAASRTDGVDLPSFVEREFRTFLLCGLLVHGFARVRCEPCATPSSSTRSGRSAASPAGRSRSERRARAPSPPIDRRAPSA